MLKGEKKAKNKETIKKVLICIKRYWFLAGLSLILAAVSVIFTLYLPILIGDAVDLIVAPGAVNFGRISLILWKMGIVIGLTALAQWLMNMCNNKITYFVVRDIRKRAFANLERLPLKYIDSHPSGDIISRMVILHAFFTSTMKQWDA